MNQQAGPSLQRPTVVLPGRPGEPPLVSNPLPLKNQVTLYFRHYTQDVYLVQLLVYLKTGRETPGLKGYFNCDGAEQDRIINDAKSESQKNSWGWTADNVGRYVASGLTQPSDLNLATGFTEEELSLEMLGKALDPDTVARLTEKQLYKVAERRVLENRAAFPRETEVEDQLRKSKQRLDAPPPLTPDEIAAHWRAAGLAALDLKEKKK